MHFLIFIPGQTAGSIEQVCKQTDLADMLVGHDVLPNVAGPGDQHGTMIGWLSPQAPLMHYSPAEQEWIPSILKIDSRPLYWVGTWKQKPPAENEIRKAYTQAGNLIELGGQRWKLPTPDTVDARAVYADDGSMRWETVRQFSWMVDEAEQLRATYLQSGEFGVRSMVFQVDPSAQVAWLLKLLKVNYRITPELAVQLDLWVGRDKILDIFLRTLGLSRKGSDG